MKRYTFELIVTEGNSESWEEITENGKTGCDDVLAMVKNELYNIGLDVDIKLTKYEDK